jgi:hypothetical protein
MLLRLLLFTASLLAGFSGLTMKLQSQAEGCEPACWHLLNYGMPVQTVRDLLTTHRYDTLPGFTERPERYEWSTDSGHEVSIIMAQDELVRLDASWSSADDRPELASLLLLFGPPDAVRIESEMVQDQPVRRMAGILIYRRPSETIVITLRRFSNNPADFGDFRLRPDDLISRVSLFSPETPFVLPVTDGWSGFAWYPTIRTCC